MTVPHRKVREDRFYKTCQTIVRNIMDHESSYVFFRPVDPVNDGAPDYPYFVVRPMSLFTVQEKLEKRLYNSDEECIDDMRQIWTNAKIYNNQAHAIYRAANTLAGRFDLLSASLPRRIATGRQESALQTAIELRFARYRSLKGSHC